MVAVRLKSIIQYLTSRIENNTFTNKLNSKTLPLPFDLISNQEDIAENYPQILPFYSSDSFESRLGINGKVKSVGVVFNSGLILENEWGKAIDNEEIVIRINFLPTLGYELHTGSKTDIRILGRNWLFRESNELLIHTYNNLQYAIQDKEIFEASEKLRLEKPLYVFNNSSWLDIYNFFGPGISNGLRAIMLALSIGEKVIIYGADPSSSKWRKGKKLTHFPSETDLEYVKLVMKSYSLLHQEYDRYFGGSAMKNGVVSSIHNTINKEYMFYNYHPNIIIAK